MPARRRCVACGKQFDLRPQQPNQSYCSEQACQRERRKLWQRERRERDPDYRENQAQAQARWLARNPDYWRKYRQRHPEYAQQNRERQRARSKSESKPSSPAETTAKSATEVAALLTSGLYRLTVIAVDRVAKMDASFLVELVPTRSHDEY